MYENNELEFEGLEKHILINFINQEHSIGCRQLTYEDLSEICRNVQCTILTKTSNDYFDAYILSESSLFVYPFKIILMTCGSTTLLKAIDLIIEIANKKLLLKPLSIIYYRNKLLFQEKQYYPHQSLNQELDYLAYNYEINKNCDISYYNIIGDSNNDHLFIYEAIPNIYWKIDNKISNNILKIMIYDIDEEIAKLFCKENLSNRGDIINNILPNSIIKDSYDFTPCGFSLNGLIDEYYYTIHITPNSGCSYISYETNQPREDYQELINNIMNIFKGKKTVINSINTKNEYLNLDKFDNYTITTFKCCKISENLHCTLYKIE